MDDREWMYTGRSNQGSFTDEWIEKTDAFLELAFARVKGARATWCPYSICANTHRQTKVVMSKHLCKNGFTADYTRWIYHGESDRMRDEVMGQRIENYDEEFFHEDGLEGSFEIDLTKAQVMEVANESGADEDAEDEVQNVKDLELLQRLHLSNDGDDDIPPSEHGDDYIDMRDSDDETYDLANPDHDDYF